MHFSTGIIENNKIYLFLKIHLMFFNNNMNRMNIKTFITKIVLYPDAYIVGEINIITAEHIDAK